LEEPADRLGVLRRRSRVAHLHLPPRLMVRPPERLTVTHPRPALVRHSVLLICKIEGRTDRVRECRSANIVRDHAMILPHNANPRPDRIFGRDIQSVCSKQISKG
jgi:hypothetical protein